MSEISRVDKSAVEQAIAYIIEDTGQFTVPEIRSYLKQQGMIFGDREELMDYAERQKTRYFIGRLVDKNGKRKFVATQKQLSFEYGNEHIYCPAEKVKKESYEEKQSLKWLRRHMISLIRRTPLLPQWAINEIISVIDSVFERMKGAA